MKQQKKVLKKQLEQFWENFQNKLNESHLFNLLKERYETLTAVQQKTVKYITGTGLLLVVFIIPLLYFTSALSHWKEFKVKYQLSLRLLKLRTDPTPFQGARSSSALKQTMEGLVKKYRMESYSVRSKKGGDRKSPVKTEIFEIKINHLNIKQVIQLGTDLNTLPSVRLEALQIVESAQYANHYDTIYEAHHYFMMRSSRPTRRPPPTKRRLSPRNPKDPKNNRNNRSIKKNSVKPGKFQTE